MSAIAKKSWVEYPTSDGKPMAETDHHRDQMVDAIQVLEHRYADQADVYVSGNLLIYYEEGNKHKHVAPDVFVAFGVSKRKRPHFLTWEEGKFPRVLFEITSKTTKLEDVQTKKDLYREVFKAKEYILFDPYGDYLKPRLQGFRRVRGQWKDISIEAGKLYCESLGLELHVEDDRLRFFDPVTQEYLASPKERAASAERRAETAEQRAEISAQQAQTARLRAQSAEERAEAARKQVADADLARTELAEENERLRRALETLRSPKIEE